MGKRLELQLPMIESYDFKIKHNKKYWYALIFFKLHCESCFSWICCQSQQKLTRKITQFTIQFHSKNVTHFTNLSSLTILKTYSINTAKNLTHLTNFLATMFLVGVRKKHLQCTIWCPKTAFLKHLESKCLPIPANLCKKCSVLPVSNFVNFTLLSPLS